MNRSGPRCLRHATAPRLILSAVLLWWAAPVAFGQTTTSTLTTGGDVMRGWRVFHDKGCADCHAVWDQGGHVGPDLGRTRGYRLSDAQLAGVMWNHIPKMLGRMQRAGRPLVGLTREQMADLFALIIFVRQLDEPGEPARGEAVLHTKGCSECHDTDASGNGIGPDLGKWGRHVNPLVWAQMMWEHAPMMEKAMQRSGMDWPKLEGDDLVHIVAFVRSTGAAGEKTYLYPGSVERGAQLFQDKKCNACHPGDGPDLAAADLPTSIAALASRMWNHSPTMMQEMRERHVEQQALGPQELADIIAYVLALNNADRGGDAERGARIFVDKGCARCHEPDETAAAGVPSIARLGASATAVDMAAAMWNHSAPMLDRMTEAGIEWPVFADREMADLSAYLRSVGRGGSAEEKGL